MELVSRAAELDRLALIFIEDGFLRLTTRNIPLLTGCQKSLTYNHQRMIRERGKNRFVWEATSCYSMYRSKTVDAYNFVAGVGFITRIQQIVEAVGIACEIYEVSGDSMSQLTGDPCVIPKLVPRIRKSEWELLRDWQRDAIRYISNRRVGRFKVTTGDGKTTMYAKLCNYFKDQRIVVVAKGIEAVMSAYTAAIGEGVVGALDTSRKKSGDGRKSRVLFTTTGKLPQYVDENFDLLLADEIHEHATGSVVSAIMSCKAKRRFGVSANADERPDNAQIWLEGLYGPLLINRKYQDGQADGNVVPICYRMLDTTYKGKGTNSTLPSDMEREYIWRNNERNAAFAAAGHYYLKQGKKVLALAQTTEQALAFRRFFDAPVVVGYPDEERLRYFRREGLLRGDDIDSVIAESFDTLQKFVAGKIKAVIAGPGWNKAKDIPDLDVVLRLDCRASLIINDQLPGRLARKAEGKEYGLLVDAWDEFHRTFEGRATTRERQYRKSGWTERKA